MRQAKLGTNRRYSVSRRHVEATRLWMMAFMAVLASNVYAAEPAYVYRLEFGQKVDVCKHMLGVFNERFRNMWEAEALGIGDDPNYSASSKYSFPRLPDVEHDTRMTFDMRYSKVPSSPEFDAIQWKEGRAIYGDPLRALAPQAKYQERY